MFASLVLYHLSKSLRIYSEKRDSLDIKRPTYSCIPLDANKSPQEGYSSENEPSIRRLRAFISVA